MKKNYFLIIVLFLLFKVNAQNIDFKELSFKGALLLSNIDNNIAKNSSGKSIKIDENDDAEIQISEALKVAELDVSSRYIVNLGGIEKFTNLKKLICSSAYLTDLDVSTLKELTYLDCSSNQIKTLDLRGLVNLETVVCAQGQFASIDVEGLTKLQKLHLDYNSLESINLSSLQSLNLLNISYNNLQTLDVTGLTQLEDLICNNNKIQSFTNLKDCSKITRLWTQLNELNSLDLSNCPNLTDLWADNNKLTSIDLTTPKNIGNARLGNNNLTFLNVDDYSNINFIRLSDNNFTTIDLSKFIKLSSAEIKNNKQLTTLFLKNGKDEGVDIEGCTSLKYICNDDIKNSTLEKYLNYYNYTNVLLNSYCTFEPGGVFYTIKGKTTIDSDNNGCDSNDGVYSALNFSIENDVQKGNFISDLSGNYEIPVGEGTYKITPILENPSYYTVTPEFLTVKFPDQNSPYIQDFCIAPSGTHQDLEVSILSVIPARPGFDATYKIIYKNKGNQLKSGSVTLDFNDSVLDFISAVPQLTSQTIGKLVWDYENLKPFETREILITLNANSPMETPAVNIGDRLSFNALITPVVDDEKPVDNSFALRQIVVGSFDPNDKTCLEGDVIKPELIGEYVHYLIRFENTGTYPAENIVVKDIIDLSKFDINTLIPTSSSHSYTTKISDGNKVEFIFDKINLPFDDAYNDGYIAFKIRTLPTLVVGDSFENEANIYFDYNFPILTNKATSTFKTLGTQDFEFSSYFYAYPNPTQNFLNLVAKETIRVQSLNIYNLLGQLVLTITNAQDVSKIDTSKLQSGNYILQIKTEIGNSTIKFIKI